MTLNIGRLTTITNTLSASSERRPIATMCLWGSVLLGLRVWLDQRFHSNWVRQVYVCRPQAPGAAAYLFKHAPQ